MSLSKEDYRYLEWLWEVIEGYNSWVSFYDCDFTNQVGWTTLRHSYAISSGRW